jgi:hypothetical protein
VPTAGTLLALREYHGPFWMKGVLIFGAGS